MKLAEGLTLRKCGGVCVASFHLFNSTTTGWRKIADLPDGFRGANVVIAPLTQDMQTVGYIDASGSYIGVHTTKTGAMSGSAAYIVA